MSAAPRKRRFLRAVVGGVAEADGNRTRRGTYVPPLVLKTREPTRRSFASAHRIPPRRAARPRRLTCSPGRPARGGTGTTKGASSTVTADNRDAIESNGYRILPGWRVGHLREESATRSGLLVPAGTESTTDALALVDIVTGLRFWAVPTGAWRFLWPDSGRVAVAVRESQIIAEEQDGSPADENSYL